MRPTDLRVVAAELFFSDAIARTPLKFGSVVIEALTYCEARLTVETAAGRRGEGWGGMFLADLWAFPDPRVTHPQADAAMREVCRRYARALLAHTQPAHPVGLYLALEPELHSIAGQVSADLALPAELPFLAALVSASPLDAAVHDAFGIVHGTDTYAMYGPDWMDDLSGPLGREFAGKHLADFIRSEFAPSIPAFHLVGGLDKLTPAELTGDDPQDDLPSSLDDWVERDGLTYLKVKLRGSDLDWDVERTIQVAAIAHEVHTRTGGDQALSFSVDTNEQCETPDYMVEYLHRLRERSPRTYDELLYLEQPTERDLRAHRWDLRPVAALKPVMVDESLTSLEDFDLAMELGWSGIALKNCKCHSAALLLAARAQAMHIPYTIQDLTNPALALLHSVGLAARLSPLCGVEANSCQFFPAASGAEQAVHSDIFRRRAGQVRTASLRGPGLGFRIGEIRRVRPKPERFEA